MTFGLGSGIAGVAGVALSQLTNVGPNLGQAYIIDSFMVVVFGGVGNLWGTLIGGMSLGIVNKLLEPYAGAVLGKILVLVALILFIQRRPRGLFPQTGRAAESADDDGAGCWRDRCATIAAARSFLGAARGRRASLVPVLNLAVPASSPLHLSTYVLTLDRQVHVLRDAGAGRRSGLGLLRHPEPRPRRVLRARRLRDGHVPDAADRHARRVRRSGAARLHGVPELEGAAVVLARLRPVLVRAADGGAGARRCWRSCSAGWRSGRASPASTCRSSRRRSATR